MAEKGRMTAVELVDKLLGSEHADVVRESVAWLVAEIMEAEVSGQIGAGLGEVSGERVTQRNGYRERAWATRAGELELRIPKLRQGSYFSRAFCSRAGAPSRRWSRSSRRPMSMAFPRARSTGWSSRWACT
jgi:transposase-like protein